MPVASAMTGAHKDHLVLASNTQWPKIQPLVSQGQIVSAVTERRMDRWTTIILI